MKSYIYISIYVCIYIRICDVRYEKQISKETYVHEKETQKRDLCDMCHVNTYLCKMTIALTL